MAEVESPAIAVPSDSTAVTKKRRNKDHGEPTDDSSSPAKRIKFNFTDLIEVRVGTGDSSQAFHVHENIITHRSKFFRTACSKHWVTGTTNEKVVDLPTDNPDAFAVYLQCVYQNEVIVGATPSRSIAALLPAYHDDDNEGPVHDADWHIDVALSAYVLADKLQDLVTCNLIINNLIGYCHDEQVAIIYNKSGYEWLYSSTPEGSPLRELLVAFCVLELDMEAFAYRSTQMPTEMMRDCLLAQHLELIRGRARSGRAGFGYLYHYERKVLRSWVNDLCECCNFHRHDDSYPTCNHRCERGEHRGGKLFEVLDDADDDEDDDRFRGEGGPIGWVRLS